MRASHKYASMAALVWDASASGYWVIWDERVALLNGTLVRLLEGTRWGAAPGNQSQGATDNGLDPRRIP